MQGIACNMWRRIRLVLFLVFTTLLFLGTSPRVDIHFDPIEGSVVDTAGRGIQGCMVVRIGLDSSREWIPDSTLTDNQGWYMLENGFPNRYTVHTEENRSFACKQLSSTTHYYGMSPFMLNIIAEEQDTVIAAFFEDSTHIWGYEDLLNIIMVDTLFINPAEVYGQPGEVRVVPPVVFKP
jgi:hypothetical protein